MFDNINLNQMVLCIEPKDHAVENLKQILENHSEIQFVSLVALDLKGHATDEKIPVSEVLGDLETFLKEGIQTDGSSVVLNQIAKLDDAKVMIKPDLDVNWFVDYNFQNRMTDTKLPVGTLRIPSFLIHHEKAVGSRAILKRAVDRLKKELKEHLKDPWMKGQFGLDEQIEVKDVVLTIATELEFWIKTPEEEADLHQLSTSQHLKEQYWKKTRGIVRTALEQTLALLAAYGFKPEMGHKEVGGVRAKLRSNGSYHHIMEQIEIDWRYSDAMQAVDNDIFVRDLVIEVFQHHGLEVTFKAKPLEGVAGSGKHTHIGINLILEDGRKVNAFAPKDMNKDYLSAIGYGALMGILKHYEAINPFVSSTTDALNRLKPGFEAPVSIVTSLGGTKEEPSRNRTVLIGLVKDLEHPLSTRFELRAPNPLSNTYLYVGAIVQAMLDGIDYIKNTKKDSIVYEKEISKAYGEESNYLEQDRIYRSEVDVFDDFSQEERMMYFGRPPQTVWENLVVLQESSRRHLLLKGEVFTEALLDSFIMGVREQWIEDLLHRIIPEIRQMLRGLKKLHESDRSNELDILSFTQIEKLKYEIMKDQLIDKSIFTKIVEASEHKDYYLVSELQVQMMKKVKLVSEYYTQYEKNIVNR